MPRSAYLILRHPDSWERFVRAEGYLSTSGIKGKARFRCGISVDGERARWVVVKVEWHAGELFPRVGSLVTNPKGRAKQVVRFYNGRGTAEQNRASTQ